MFKKKLEVVELNKQEEQIVLEEKQNYIVAFWHKHRFHLLAILLVLAFLIFIGGMFIFISNIYKSNQPTVTKTPLETSLTDENKYITGSPIPLTEDAAKNQFLNNSKFKPNGEVLTIKVVESSNYIIKFYSDKTALKIMKNSNLITRINPLENGDYGIDKYGVINTNATIKDIYLTTTKEYPWGTVSYFSDGSAEITNSEIDMFVRNAKDISDNYISNNKVTYLKETKAVGKIKLNYYYDGTILVEKNNQNFIVRSENDLNITDNDVLFKNNNAATIIKTKKMKNGIVIDYYQDGGAIIKDGTKTISVRKSNSIIINDNDIYEIVDNIYVEVSYKVDNITYYTNGGAVFNYNNKTYYTDENSNIKYQNNQISTVEGEKEELTKTTNIEDEKVSQFEKTAVIETSDYIAIVPKDGILYDKDGKIEKITTDELEEEDNIFTITNNTDKEIKYRLVIEKSDKTDLDVQYIRYQLQVKEKYYQAKRLDNNIWYQDNISNSLNIKGTNYILLDDVIEPYDTVDIRLMLWTDYETIPNSMQNKYFYGTIKVYSWIEG